MKEFLLNKSMNKICKYDSSVKGDKVEVIRYGLEALYMTIFKFIVISAIAFIFGIFKEHLIFLLTYNIIRTFAGGVHAKNSNACLISSLIIFLVIPYLCTILVLNIYVKYLISIISIIIMVNYAPADTIKKPMLKRKKKYIYKTIATILSIIYLISAIVIKNEFVSNILLFSVILASSMIIPLTYKIYNVPYNNYKQYKY